MSILDIERKINPILERYGIMYAGVFGSVARGEDGPLSDVDLFVKIGKPMGMFSYMDFIEGLEQALHKRVDVVTDSSVNAAFRPYIMADLKTIYER